jgi:transposase
MGTIIKKIIRGNPYYYYTESVRKDGKPTHVNEKYLGNAEKLLKMAISDESPIQESVHYSDEYEFGLVALLYSLAVRLGLTGIIDSVVTKRNQGASVGWYILIETINKIAGPSSTQDIQGWYEETYLPCLTGIGATAFTAQNFWNNTNKITENELDQIEDAILTKILEVYDIDVSNLIYHAPTNFFTYIDTTQDSNLDNQDSNLAKRGQGNSKRKDLCKVGLALIVSPDFSIPLIHETYPGHTSHDKEFTKILSRLKDNYKSLTSKEISLTVTFDKDNNNISQEKIDLLLSGHDALHLPLPLPLHFVGELTKDQAAPLWAISKDKFTPLEGECFIGESAYRLDVDVFGHSYTGLIVYNPVLENSQMKRIKNNIEKTRKKLFELHESLNKCALGEIKITEGKKPSVESVQKSVKAILKTEYMEDIFICDVYEKGNFVFLNFNPSEKSLEKIRRDMLGKTALFTDRSDFSNEKILRAYQSGRQFEHGFRSMKDPNHLTVRPMLHWSDKMSKIDIFTSVLAYRLCCLLIKELDEQGLKFNINQLIKQMSKIKIIETFYGDHDKPKKIISYTRSSELAEKVMSLYKLKL